jgi:hypothetical protein
LLPEQGRTDGEWSWATRKNAHIQAAHATPARKAIIAATTARQSRQRMKKAMTANADMLRATPPMQVPRGNVMNLPTTNTRVELDSLLGALEASLPAIIQRNPADEDFWSIFAGDAGVIERAAGPEDSGYVRGSLDCMLKNEGMIPGESEGESRS